MRRSLILTGKKNRRDDRGSAIVIVIIAMALVSILATTIIWASYLNYRIKLSDLKVKNSFYSAETVVEQILAGVKKDIVSASVNEAYQDVVSNWDALGSDSNRESYFLMAYIEQVEERLKVNNSGEYDKSILRGFVDSQFWDVNNAQGHIDEAAWDAASPVFRSFEDNRLTDPDESGSMTIKNICVEFYDSGGFLSVINTDIAIDVPKLRFTQAGTIDRLYPYVLVGGEGIVTEEGFVNIDGSIYGGVNDRSEGGIQIGRNSHVTVENAAYIISGGDIVIGNETGFVNLVGQDAELIVRGLPSGGAGFRTNIYAQGIAVNSGHLDISGKIYIADDLILSGKGSNVSLSGQYIGYGNETGNRLTESGKDADGNDITVSVNPAESSSAIVINGRNSAVDLTGLNALLLAGRAYVSLSDDDGENALPHILMGESISVKSNQIAYLVPPECVGTLDGRTVIGQNPVSFGTWTRMVSSMPDYADKDFRIVDADKTATKLGGGKLADYGIGNIAASELGNIDPDNIPAAVTALNNVGKKSNIRFLYMAEKDQVYLYLVLDKDNAEEYFAAYYNVNSNKASLDSYFNQYASGGIRLKENVQGYTVVGNSMVSLTSAENGDNIVTSPDGGNLVRLLSSVTFQTNEDSEDKDDEDGEQPRDPYVLKEVSDNITNIENIRSEDELLDIAGSCRTAYGNLNRNLDEEDAGIENTVFDNLVMLKTPPDSAEGVVGLIDYLAAHGGKVEFTAGELRAVLVNAGTGTYTAADSKLRLVIAIGDVEVKSDFQGLIIASGKITVAQNVSCKKDSEGVYKVLQATNTIDSNVPANVLQSGPGMIENGYEGAKTDELGNMSIDYSDIVRYENWIKK